MRLNLLSLSAVVLLSSCSVQPVTNCISVPPFPIMPTLTIEQDASIPDDIYKVLSDREQLRQAYTRALLDRIQANNERCK